MKTDDELREEAYEQAYEANEEIQSEVLRITKLLKNGEQLLTIPASHFGLAEELALSTHRNIEDLLTHALVEYAKRVWPDEDLSGY
tara:strand:+ start:1790 stop:2047 length:258 start_codon:yes stop_codon:yes gene_type:complete